MDLTFEDTVVAVVALILATISVAVLLEVKRLRICDKRERMRDAREALERHFAALNMVVSDKEVCGRVKNLLLQFSAVVTTPSISHEVTRDIVLDERPKLTPIMREALDHLISELQAAMIRNKTIGHAIAQVIEFGFLSVVARWPAPRALAKIAFLDAETHDGEMVVRAKAERILEKIPEQVFANGSSESIAWVRPTATAAPAI